jgi:hypothetical protein
MIGYTIYRPDGTSERGEVDWPPDPGYDQIAALVEPLVEGPIERVRVLDPAKADADEIRGAADYLDMFVDEMGHMRTPPRPRNEAATAIYRANWLRAHPDVDPEDIAWIAGTAVLFDRPVWT